MATSVVNTAGLVAGYVEPVVGVVTFPVTVTPAEGALELSWDTVEGATSYTVYCGLVLGQLSPIAELIAETSYSITGLRSSQQYYLQVTAIFSANHSIGSDIGNEPFVPIPITPPDEGTVQFDPASYGDVPGALPNNYTITVTRLGDNTLAASVNYGTSNGTLVAPTNYTATSGQLNWGAGDSTPQTFQVHVISGADTQFFNMALNSPSGVTLGSPSSATFTLHDV